MFSEIALSIEQVSKTYHLYDRPQDRLKQILVRGKRQYYREYQALKPITYSLAKGEVLGVVGRNGAGKSTLLQLICGTLNPTTGSIRVNGRIAALLELGAGFNPQFTGRENIYLSASIMGVDKEEVENKIDDIIDFAGVRNFIDQPVSTYSSGMYVRLAFSVATSVEPDILIIDEALSVGDGDFARRSFERIMAMKEKGATILFCSHSLYQIEVLCSKAIWLEKGQLIKVGEPAKIVSDYQAFLDLLSHDPSATPDQALAQRPIVKKGVEAQRQGEYARLTQINASTPEQTGELLPIISGQTNVTLTINFISTLKGEVPQLAVVIHDGARKLISSFAAWADGIQPTLNSEGHGQVTLTLPQLSLLKGTYHLGVLLFDQRGLFLHDEADPVATLEVSQTGPERGVVMLPHNWQISIPKARIAADAKVTKRQPTNRWQSRIVSDDDFPTLQNIFQDAFKHPIDEALWRWKYSNTQVPSYVVEEEGEVIAYCGGVSREGYVSGQATLFCQLVDVMVHSKKRGVLTKTGPFYRCVVPFMTDHIGPDKDCSHLFGFPNHRHLRAGARQSLYTPVDRILEMAWPAKMGQYKVTQWHGEADIAAQINDHWQQMLQQLPNTLIGKRDSKWLQYRYLQHPHGGYKIYIVQNAAATHCHGVIVLKDRPDTNQLELMDFIAEPNQAQEVILAAQQQTQIENRSQLFAWLTPKVAGYLESTKGELQETDIVVPENGMSPEQYVTQASQNWWLMGGDSDFR